MQMKIVVLGTKNVKFEDKEKNAVEGVRVHYSVEGGKQTDDTKGMTPVQAFLKGGGAKDLVKAVPGFYLGDFEVGVKDNKPDLKLIGLNFEAPASIVVAKAG